MNNTTKYKVCIEHKPHAGAKPWHVYTTHNGQTITSGHLFAREVQARRYAAGVADGLRLAGCTADIAAVQEI